MTLVQFIRIIRARIWIVLLALIVTTASAVALSIVLPKKYSATSSLFIDFGGIDRVAGRELSSQMAPEYIATQLDILRSRKVAYKVVNSLDLADDPETREAFTEDTGGRGSIQDWLAGGLLEKLAIDVSPDSSIIKLTYTSSKPKRAADIANAFAQHYMATNLELKVNPARQTADWFDDQTKSLLAQLEKAQAKLSAFQQEKGIIASDEKMDADNTRLIELTTQLVQAQNQAFDNQNRASQIKDLVSRGGSAEALPEVLASSFIQNLKGDLLRAEAKLQELSAHLGKNHPQYQRAQAEADSLRKKLNEQIKTVTTGVGNVNKLSQQRESELRNAIAEQKTKMLAGRRDREAAAVLTKAVEQAQKSYDTALERYFQTSLQSRVDQSNVELLTSAIEPIEPSFPKLPLNTALGIVLGGLLGLGIAFVLELSDKRVRSMDDIADVFGLPVLGSLDRGGAFSSGPKLIGSMRALPNPSN